MSHSATTSRPIKHAAKAVRHVQSLAHDAKSTVGHNGTQLVSKVKSLGDRLQDGKKAAVTQVKRAAKSVRVKAAAVDKTIRAKPYHALSVAAGAGIVAGYLISRRRSKAS
jgi:ElaB/YqjD/DUF883 family membrane-anchored ribosome-binding protein